SWPDESGDGPGDGPDLFRPFPAAWSSPGTPSLPAPQLGPEVAASLPGEGHASLSLSSVLAGEWFEAKISRRGREWIFALVTLLVIAATFSRRPVLQDPAYNHFADDRAAFAVPYFLDVVSNLGLLVAGTMGLALLFGRRDAAAGRAFQHGPERWPYLVLFAGVALAALGSGYYHWAPSDGRLVWDRLPMTVVFMSLVSITIAERIDLRLGQVLLTPLLALGIASVVYWHFTELRRSGDLRVYLDVQYLSIVAVPILGVLFPSRYTHANEVYLVVAIYLIAKLFELADGAVYSLGHVMSGHTVKHLLAAWACFRIVAMLRRRALRAPLART
ncbi:MAG: hypothetical protein ACRDHY_12580, partial [Anaerolineales bacterium]